NLDEYPSFVIDFMKDIPTLWDETVYIDGYPGKYVVLARRSGKNWYIAGINAEKETKEIEVDLPMLAGESVQLYTDKKDRSPQMSQIKINDSGKVKLTIQSDGGTIITK
ncbi:MAG: glycoside hydrolase family 97 C-terminal domain-containing protein, partial [Fermentimonas sp.]|nr:glycoside hydrolase family 97 protein [Bacteroidales bacterium]